MITDQDKNEIAKILEELVEHAGTLATETMPHVSFHINPVGQGCYAVVDYKEIVTPHPWFDDDGTK